MCFDHDSHPPIEPIAGGSIAHEHLELTAADGTRFMAFRADAANPTGAGIIVLPDVRGLHRYYEELTLRFAEAGIDAIAIDFFGRSAGIGDRGEGFDFMPHVAATTWETLQQDVAAAAAHLRATRGVQALYDIGFCFGGRLALDLATVSELALDGVIAFYGWPVGAARNDLPAPVDARGPDGVPGAGHLRRRRPGHPRASAWRRSGRRSRAAGRRPPGDQLPGRAPQLLRPQAGGVRRGVRRGVGRGAAVRAALG